MAMSNREIIDAIDTLEEMLMKAERLAMTLRHECSDRDWKLAFTAAYNIGKNLERCEAGVTSLDRLVRYQGVK